MRKIFLTSFQLAGVLIANPPFAKQSQNTHKSNHVKHPNHKKQLPPATGTPTK